MASCAACGCEAAPHLCSRCRRARYCTRTCQTGHWKQHKSECVAAASSSETVAGDLVGACPECRKAWEECACEDTPSCYICLESSGQLLRGCACRGSAGYIHVACLVEANRHRKSAQHECPTCKQRYVGALGMAAAKARVQDARASSTGMDWAATSDLAQACAEQGHYDESMRHFQNVLKSQLKRVGRDHPAVSTTYNKFVHACLCSRVEVKCTHAHVWLAVSK